MPTADAVGPISPARSRSGSRPSRSRACSSDSTTSASGRPVRFAIAWSSVVFSPFESQPGQVYDSGQLAAGASTNPETYRGVPRADESCRNALWARDGNIIRTP